MERKDILPKVLCRNLPVSPLGVTSHRKASSAEPSFSRKTLAPVGTNTFCLGKIVLFFSYPLWRGWVHHNFPFMMLGPARHHIASAEKSLHEEGALLDWRRSCLCSCLCGRSAAQVRGTEGWLFGALPAGIMIYQASNGCQRAQRYRPNWILYGNRVSIWGKHFQCKWLKWNLDVHSAA